MRDVMDEILAEVVRLRLERHEGQFREVFQRASLGGPPRSLDVFKALHEQPFPPEPIDHEQFVQRL
ncbi:hypothetical protein [Deinococcus ruber]|uniref:Uncharacterized protein n=1 Tax=Deinococcus ruber TaxID=1848197 RepID=A0A918FGU8_9DEIO|nr:hypothetical protein [Deinococcus ruber]GGR36845.1 hypothetical protein GCM10008957_53010 [Deinococcus ruber]